MDSGNGIKKSCMSRFVVAQLLQLGFSQEAAEHASWRLVSAMDESDGGGVAPTVDQAVQFALEFANGGSDGSHARLILPSIAAIPSDVLKASLDSASAPESGSGSVSAGTVQTDNGEDRQAPVSALDTASAPIAIPPSMIPIPGLLPAASRHPHGGQNRNDFINLAANKELERIQQFKKNAQTEKKALLQQIKEDRQRMREKRAGGHFRETPTAPPTVSKTTPLLTTSASTTNILFRLPREFNFPSPTLRQAFASTSIIADLFTFLKSKHASQYNLQLQSSFPQRVFLENADQNTITSLLDAGLAPSASLNVSFSPAPEAVPFGNREAANSVHTYAPEEIEGVVDVHALLESHDHAAHSEEEERETNSSNEDEQMDDVDNDDDENEVGDDAGAGEEMRDSDEDEQDIPTGFNLPGRRLGDVVALPLPPGRGRGRTEGRSNFRGVLLPGGRGRGALRAGNRAPGAGNPFVGTGNRLGDVSEPMEVTPTTHEVIESETSSVGASAPDGRALRLAAIQHRVSTATASFGGNPNRKARSAQRLLDLAAHACVALLSMHGNQKALKEHQSFALRCLGADLLQLIVNASVKSRKLDRFMVKRLALCGINRYNFDSYSLATDSLMEAISIHHWNSLERLSLKGAFVTDEGIFHLQTCRSLEFLDLSGCRVTDHVFQVFPTFSRLYSLNLSRTKISSAGLKQFVSSGSVPPLEYLNLSFCENVTSSDTFLDLTQLTTNWLRVLSLQGCQLKCPLSVPINPRVATAALEVLDLSRIQSLTDVDFQTLSMFVNLLDLDLTGSGSPPAVLQPTPSAATATTLNPRHLHATELDEESPGPGMRLLVTRLGATLHRLSLPHKQSRSINAITRILLPAYGMVALTSLDFTGFMWLTDSGILHLRAAHELRVLCLAGTQITEEGFRAAFSGAGSDGRVLCPKLIEVNVDRSAIGEGIFVALRDHALIETLGLSETPVTDDGIGKLMPECRFRFTLRKLNLARTEVTEVGVVKALSGYVNLGSLNLERTGVSSLAAVVFGLEAGARNSGLHLNGSFLSGGIRWAPILSETAVTAGLHNEGDEIE